MKDQSDSLTTENNRLDNGQFAKGNPGKPLGSSKNKLRDSIRSFLNENWEHFPTWFEALKAKEKIDVMLDLMPYAVSRLQSVSMTDQEGHDLPERAVIDYTKLSQSTLKEIIAATTLNETSHV